MSTYVETAEKGIVCPSCKVATVTVVTHTRRRVGGIVRKRECPCGRGFATREVVIGGGSAICGPALKKLADCTPQPVPPLVIIQHGDHGLRSD